MKGKPNMYYHGSTTALQIEKYIHPPNTTGVLREDFRKKNRDVVFVTQTLKSAKMYAYKARNKFGGQPVVYVVYPRAIRPASNGELICSKAEIVDTINLDIN